MEFEISLKDIKFYSYHGVYEQERRTGNEFIVNLSVFIEASTQIEDDQISSTVSYAELFSIVENEMRQPRNLMEKVAMLIVERIKKEFPKITRGHLRIEKTRPPIPGMLGSASITLWF